MTALWRALACVFIVRNVRAIPQTKLIPKKNNITADAATCSGGGNAGLCPNPGTVGAFPDAAMTLASHPTGNAYPTFSTFVVQGATAHNDSREFVAQIGLTSTMGGTANSTPWRDKVALYTGVDAMPGTGDVWSINPLLTQHPGSGSYDAQGIELDFNNNNAHRGDADAGAGLAPPVSYGFTVTGAGAFRGTAAIGVMGLPKMWNRGIVFANDAIAQSSFQDLGNPPKSVDIRGSPGYGIYQASSTTKNYFAGGTGMGAGADAPRATLDVRGDVLYTGRLLKTSAAGPAGTGDSAGTGGAGDRRQAAVLAEGDSAPLLLSGMAQLDGRGRTTVALPASAIPDVRAALKESVGGGVRYQLTAVGAPMPMLHVAEEVAWAAAGGAIYAFRVDGGVPGKKVSWQVVIE